ncbi:MAG TPA: gamma carbonic anhydrase family protein [Gammaproteobacteria bacterium]|nr:gamma carbonic anhydrase family protein [Gammaproteobacteria bacterium]
MPVRPFRDTLPVLGARVYLDEAALVIGAVRIGDDASLWPYVVARGDVNRIQIGARSNIQDLSMLHVTHDGPYTPGGYPLVIGEDVTVGHKCLLHACRIGNRCLIGMGAIVMDGAVVEDEVLLGAGSLVSPGKQLASGFLYHGNPARQVRALHDAERDMLRYSAQHYMRLKDHYLNSTAPPLS